MKKVTSLFCLVALLGGPGIASAGDDKSITLAVNYDPTGPVTFAGNFVAGGAANGVGASEAILSLDAQLNLVVSKTFHLAGGDVTLVATGPLVVQSDGCTAFYDSYWEWSSGTGAYAGITGKGKGHAIGNLCTGSFIGVYDGKLRLP
jgi:hypothetical protein